MGNRTIIPFGPQHPVLPEPIHLDLVLEDERVIEAIPSIGFIHRGLEKLVEKKDFQEYVYVAERICGICSFIHGMGYCQSVEGIMKLDIPDRSKFLRTIWSELSRMHSHLMWMGLLADAFGFESLFMQCWRQRELILDLFDMTTGGRVIFSVCKIGGVRRDISGIQQIHFLETLQQIESEVKSINNIFFNDASVKHRLVGVGLLSKEDAHILGACGPMMRASGIEYDTRLLGYAAYGQLDFKPITRPEGDGYARCVVRAEEILQSIDLIRQCFERMQTGPIDMKVTGNPNGEYFSRLEQPRGEVIYYTRGNGSKFLERMRVRTPTFANLAPLLKILPGSELADVPLQILTIDPCISCTER
jgi:ech hydrogenase subunit E